MPASDATAQYREPITCLPRDAGLPHDFAAYAVDLTTDYLGAKTAEGHARFNAAAELRVPRLDGIFSSSRGNFGDLIIDLLREDSSEIGCEIAVKLRGVTIDTRVLHKWYRSTQIFVPVQLLYEHQNVLEVTALSADTASLPPIRIRCMLSSKARIMATLERDSIWVFSAPRSGSTWLSRDILCWLNQTRPMDETGLGRLLSPMELHPERFFELERRSTPFESGMPFERDERARTGRGIPPFVRHFPETSRTEPMEQCLAREHSRLFFGQVRDLALEHVLAVWGFLGFQRICFKCTADAQGADLIMPAFPNAHMIFLIRDGRDVVRSQCSPFISGGAFAAGDTELRRYYVAYYAHLWNFRIDIIQAAFDRHPQERRWLSKYEELRRNPTPAIRNLFRHLGIAITEEQLATLVYETTLENVPEHLKGPDKPRQSGEIGGYADFFTAEETQLMNAIMGDNLRRYGYMD